MTHDDRIKLEYSEVGNLNRHYSTIRATLTTFLLMVALGAFAGYFTGGKSPYFFSAGIVLLVTAILTCLHFSYLTELSNLYLTELWVFSKKNVPDTENYEPKGFKSFAPSRWSVLLKVVSDPMNWLLLILIAAVAALFFAVEPTPTLRLGKAIVIFLVCVFCISTVAILLIVRESQRYREAVAIVLILAVLVGGTSCAVLFT